jgi:hypothetical protein
MQPVQKSQVYEGVFDTSGIESGLYLIRARTAHAVATRRIVCTH